MKTNKFLSYVMLILLFVFLLNLSGVAAQIGTIEMFTASTAGSWYKIGAGIVEKANEFFEGFPITALPSTGSVGNPPIVNDGRDEAHFGMSYGPFLKTAQSGEEPYEKPLSNLRSVAALTYTVVTLQVDVKPEVDSVYELIKNKVKIRLAVSPKGGGGHYIAKLIFSAMGLESPEDIEEWGSSLYYSTSGDRISAWRDRHVNASMNVLNVPASAVEESLIGRKGKILNMGEELIKALKKKGFQEFTIPAGTYSGQDEDVVTVALPLVIFTREDVPEDVVYYITKAIYENKDYMINVHSSFKSFDPNKMATGLGIEIHKGAEKFYKEVGL